MPALGEEFRSAREARGLSLSDVAERLHIRSVYLAAIEDEDWKAIGAPVYVRGFMRTYARFLGLDAEDAVARFAASPAGAPPAPAVRPEERPRERERERQGAGERSSPSLVAILAVLIAIGVVGYVAYSFAQYRASGPVPVAAASPDVTQPDADASGAPESIDAVPSPPPAVAVAAAKPRKRPFHVAITQTSWLKITIDGTVVAEGTYPPGTAKSFNGRVADVVVGNAGGVHISVNGRSVGSLGNSGDVTERRFVLSGE